MKLVFTVTNDLLYDQRMQRICRTLQEAGHEVSLIGRLKKNSAALASESYQQIRLKCRFEKGKLFYLEYNLRLLFYLWFHPAFDIYTGIDLDTIAPNLLIARLKGKKCYYDAHEYFSELPELVHRPSTKFVWEMLAKICIPGVDQAYTVGPALAQVFQERYGIPFGVVRNVPWKAEADTQVPHSSLPIILYQGVLNVGRGLETAIEAMQKMKGVQLFLAGEGDLSKSLRQLAHDLGVEHQVRFLGYKTPAELKAITREASIGLNLLENLGLNYYYSLANKAFDYVQAGIPSIQMNFPEYLALQEEHRVFYLINRLDVDVLVQAIEHLLADHQLYLILQENCKQAAAEWCWEKEREHLIKLY